MGKIHQRAHRDLAYILSDTNRFADPIELISPSGQVQNVTGNIVYSQSEETSDSVRFIRNNPSVTIELALLTIIPQAGERWIIRIPISKTDTTISSFTISSKPVVNRFLGYITLKLNKAEQI